MVKKSFISFAGGNPDFLKALDRLINQARQTKMFDEVQGFTEDDLKKDGEFWNAHSDFIKNNQRGFGYWIWKPYIIQKKLSEMNDDDILVYLDAGCEIKLSEKEELHKYFEIVQKDLLIGTNAFQSEEMWTKADLLHKLNIYDTKYFTTQRQAGVLMIKKTDETMNLLNEWYSIATDDNYHNINDSPSVLENHSSFIEHRHDQSIFSLLTKKYGIFSDTLLGPPFYALRNRKGESQLEGFTNYFYFNWVYFILIAVIVFIYLFLYVKGIRRFLYKQFALLN